MSDLNRFRYTMESCNHCGQCKWILPSRMWGWDFAEVCPIHARYGFDACSGQGLLNMARERMENKLQWSEGMAKLVHGCTACGACDVNCKSVRDMELQETIYALRQDCAESGFLPEAKRRTAENIRKTGNRHGLPPEERFMRLPEELTEHENADTVLFLGCDAYRRPETALAAIRILKAGGVRFRILREEQCCGAYLWRAGLREQAAEQMERNARLFRERGIRTVITACAECFGSFRNYYPRVTETPFETKHITQIAAELIRDGRLHLKGTEKPLALTYHDPCMLGRLSETYVPWEGEIRPYGLHVPEKHWNRGENGVYDPPREVLKAIPGVTLKEMIRYKEEAWCCGAQAAEIDPDLAAFAAGERLREAAFTGAEAIVSCCPYCRDALSPEGEQPIRYLDLTEFLAAHIREEAET